MYRMRDDQDFNIRFVQIIKNARCLYDKSLPEYRSKEEHDRVWQKVAQEANESGKKKQIILYDKYCNCMHGACVMCF